MLKSLPTIQRSTIRPTPLIPSVILSDIFRLAFECFIEIKEFKSVVNLLRVSKENSKFIKTTKHNEEEKVDHFSLEMGCLRTVTADILKCNWFHGKYSETLINIVSEKKFEEISATYVGGYLHGLKTTMRYTNMRRYKITHSAWNFGQRHGWTIIFKYEIYDEEDDDIPESVDVILYDNDEIVTKTYFTLKKVWSSWDEGLKIMEGKKEFSVISRDCITNYVLWKWKLDWYQRWSEIQANEEKEKKEQFNEFYDSDIDY